MSLNILLEAGTDTEKKYARRLQPILKRHHLLLVTLLLWNALAMEALPLFLDRMLPEFLAVALSVSFVLIFGEVLPQAIISRFGLAIGGNLAWFVQVLMFFAFPIAWPFSKVLDLILGHGHSTFYKRAELKELVNIHGMEKSEGGILTNDEINVIKGALELKEKIVESITTPLNRVYMLPLEAQMDTDTMDSILKNGHSRVPVYRNGNRQDIIGLLLIKNLIKLNPYDPTPIADLTVREIPSVLSNVQLWDVLNMFQNGKSHMALVKKKWITEDESNNNSTIIGIVTLEDVFEELIQEEIVDETDVFVDMSKQVRVADMFRRISNSITITGSPGRHSRYILSSSYGSVDEGSQLIR
jgi:metal transporter CNNM